MMMTACVWGCMCMCVCVCTRAYMWMVVRDTEHQILTFRVTKFMMMHYFPLLKNIF